MLQASQSIGGPSRSHRQPRFSLLDGAYHAVGTEHQEAASGDSLALAKRAQQALQLTGADAWQDCRPALAVSLRLSANRTRTQNRSGVLRMGHLDMMRSSQLRNFMFRSQLRLNRQFICSQTSTPVATTVTFPAGPLGQVSSASEYLQKRRIFKGLEAPLVGAEQKPVVKAVQGQTGRAAQYTHEAVS